MYYICLRPTFAEQPQYRGGGKSPVKESPYKKLDSCRNFLCLPAFKMVQRDRFLRQEQRWNAYRRRLQSASGERPHRYASRTQEQADT
jgi:hypothetical protein